MSMRTAVEILTRQQRRRRISESASVRGLDSVTALISPGDPSVELFLAFVPSSPACPDPSKDWRPAGLTPASFRIHGPGGGMVVESVSYTGDTGPVCLRALTRTPLSELTGPLNPEFTLRFHDVPDLDPFFAESRFILRIRDGASSSNPVSAPSAAKSDPVPFIDYLNKDYASFRRLMLDSMTLRDPTWRERNPADLGVVLIELLAYAGDYLSYYQDAAATEAYLFTACRRTSVRRHVRLADYRLHEGCSARVWVFVSVLGQTALPKGTQFVTGGAGTLLSGRPPQPTTGDTGNLRVFESMHPVNLAPRRNGMRIYTWGASVFTLRRGDVRCTLDGCSLGLRGGDTIIFETAEVTTGVVSRTALPGTRHAVRLRQNPVESFDILYDRRVTHIEWFSEDALPADFEVLSPETSGSCRTTVARGNIVLCDMGQSVGPFPLPVVPLKGNYRPWLEYRGLTFASPYDPAAPLCAALTPRQNPAKALPQIHLTSEARAVPDNRGSWSPVPDLLGSGPFDRHFVVETEAGGKSYLRFGDGWLGRRPPRLAPLFSWYRVGDGARGNIGADTLSGVYSADTLIEAVRNPLPAEGGTAFENLEAARLFATGQGRLQVRCITQEDYRQRAMLHSEVLGVALERRFGGNREVDALYAQRSGGLLVDDAFRQSLANWLEPFRMLGRTIFIHPPVFVAVRIELDVLVNATTAEFSVAAAGQALDDLFGSGLRASGEKAFFHPDNFRFQQPLYASAIISAALDIQGVVAAAVKRFDAVGLDPAESLLQGLIETGPNQIIRVDNDASAPENGQISFRIQAAPASEAKRRGGDSA